MASYRSYPPLRNSSNATAIPGTITGNSFKAWWLTSSEITAVNSPSTWIGATHRNNSFLYSLLATMYIGRWSDFSLHNSGPKCHVGAGVNASAAAYKKVGTLPILIIPNVIWLETGSSWLITRSCGAAELDGRQGIVRSQRCGVQDVPFQEPLQDGGSWLVRESAKLAVGHVEYKELHMVIIEAVAGFAHLYTYGVSKCSFL